MPMGDDGDADTGDVVSGQEMTRGQREGRNERFRLFVSRHNEAFAAAALTYRLDLGPGALLVRVRELSGADAFTDDGDGRGLPLGYMDRYRVTKTQGYAAVVAMVDRCGPNQFVAVADYGDGTFDAARYLIA
jgi:hypothetical protein